MCHHLLTVAVEDYFHVAALRGAVRREHWGRLEPRLERALEMVLELLARHSAGATFFVFGRIAETQPELVERIVAAGHEVASRGYWPRSTAGMTRDEFVEDAARARCALEQAGANRILGFRSPTWIQPAELWKLDVLAEEGYVYDASINPRLWSFARHPERLRVHRHRGGSFLEFPVSTTGPPWLRLPFTGGNYIRQIPHTLLKHLVHRASRGGGDPLVFYLMPWEMDANQPRIQGITAFQRVRHYRNLGKARWVFEDYLRQYRFVGIADHLGLAHAALSRAVPKAPPLEATSAPPGTPVTLVVPLYNEEKNVAYLRRTLAELRARLAGRYHVHLVLVEDGSRDGTRRAIEEEFRDVPDCRLVAHEANRGVAAAILTGIREASTEIVCSIDCDCSYDPVMLEKMLPRAEEADLVTASPYHPQGRVVNVPAWRLFLSKTLSRLYSGVLRERIFTYTSCCRVYRRSRMLSLPLRHGGFLGTAEMLIQTKLAGGKIVEVAATLESRLLGESKIKVARTILGHAGLLLALLRRRLREARASLGVPA
jgi:polysaccharide deacetylase family protein (PEP-CTERM system associated)